MDDIGRERASARGVCVCVSACACVCLSVCVCVCERERARARDRESGREREMVRMGCLKPIFRLCCGCCVKKKASLRSQGATYTKVPLSVAAAVSVSLSL